MFCLIRRSYTRLDMRSFRCLFNCLLGPHLEYCDSIWFPLLKKDEDFTKNVLHRTRKLIPGLYDKPYKEGLTAMKVP